MTEKQFKPGQRIQIKLSGGRIEEATVKAVIEQQMASDSKLTSDTIKRL
jgi:hypothetical protein